MCMMLLATKTSTAASRIGIHNGISGIMSAPSVRLKPDATTTWVRAGRTDDVGSSRTHRRRGFEPNAPTTWVRAERTDDVGSSRTHRRRGFKADATTGAHYGDERTTGIVTCDGCCGDR